MLNCNKTPRHVYKLSFYLFKPIHMEIQILIEVLEHSVKKNGADKPVTLGHLLNLVRLADKTEEKEADEDNIYPYDPNWD